MLLTSHGQQRNGGNNGFLPNARENRNFWGANWGRAGDDCGGGGGLREERTRIKGIWGQGEG